MDLDYPLGWRTNRSLRNTVKSVLVHALAFLTCAITLFPLYWMFVTAMLDSGDIFNFPPPLYPSTLSLDSFRQIMEARPIIRWLGNTLLITGASTIVALLVSSFGAYSLSRFRFRGRLPAIAAILVTQMLPIPLIVIPLYVLFRDLQLLSTYAGLVLGYTTFTLPLCIWVLKGFFDGIPVELEEAAMIDGCSRVGALYHVVLPLSLPGLAATTVLAIITGWNEFILAVTLTNEQAKWVMSVGLSSFIGEYQIPWNQIAAGALVMVIPIVLAFAFLQQYLVSGLASGALKG